MIRHCDGTDPNLTRQVRADDYDAATMTISPWNRGHTARGGPGGHVVIQCQCDRTFDDAERTVTWPHDKLAPGGTITVHLQEQPGVLNPAAIALLTQLAAALRSRRPL